MSAYTGMAVLVTVVLSAGCASIQHAPESVRSELLVRVSVSACDPHVPCVPSAEGRRYQGALLAFESDSLTLLAWEEPDPTVTIPVASVDRVELYRGRRPSVESAVKRGLLGGLLGAAGGAVVGAIAGAPFDEAGEAAGRMAATGAGVGLVGGVYSGIFQGDDHWEAVSLRSLRTLYCLTNEKTDCDPDQDLVATPPPP